MVGCVFAKPVYLTCRWFSVHACSEWWMIAYILRDKYDSMSVLVVWWPFLVQMRVATLALLLIPCSILRLLFLAMSPTSDTSPVKTNTNSFSSRLCINTFPVLTL